MSDQGLESETQFQIQTYKKDRKNVIWAWQLVGGIHLVVIATFFLWSISQILMLPPPVLSRVFFSLADPGTLVTLSYLGLLLITAIALLVCGWMVIDHHWGAIITGYWVSVVLLMTILFSPLCILSPLYLMIFLESRELYLASYFLMQRGYDLSQLPDVSEKLKRS